MKALLAAALVSTASAPPAFSGAWVAWQSAAPIVYPALGGDSYVRVPLGERVDAGADGRFSSLRVVTSDGVERPYALDPQAETQNGKSPESLPIVDSGLVAGSYTQAVLDLGTRADVHEAVRIATSKATYFERVSVEASDDRTTWRSLRDDAIVYAVASDANGRSDAGNQTIAFAPTRSRWLRLRVLDASARFPIDGAATDTGPVREVLVPVATAPTLAVEGHRQTWTFSFGSAHVDVSAVELVGGTRASARSVSVETSDDGKTFALASDAERLAYRPGAAAPNHAFGSVAARVVRVTIDNGDDVAVPGLHPIVFRRPHELVFRAEPGVNYTLLASTFVTTAPTYDLDSILDSRDWHADRIATLGPFVANAAFRDPRPLTERLPWLVGVSFALAAIVLGWLALSTIRGASRATMPTEPS